jgi:predicted XRE-type DNA-binding protein
MSDEEMYFEESSGNVFDDLGLPNPEERLMKADLSIQIARIIRERGLTQREAAKEMGIDQPKVSNILRGRLSGFSMERLTVLLMRLGSDVEMVVRPKAESRRQGVFSVVSGRRSTRPRRRAAGT